MRLPRTWTVYENEDRDVKAERLKQRFAAISKRAFARKSKSSRLVALLIAAFLGLAGFMLWFGFEHSREWTADEMARHLAAMPNCAAARAVGLAPARIGRPGYWPAHDADNDGWACEPWLR